MWVVDIFWPTDVATHYCMSCFDHNKATTLKHDLACCEFIMQYMTDDPLLHVCFFLLMVFQVCLLWWERLGTATE